MEATEELSKSRTVRLGYLSGELHGPLLMFFIAMLVIGCFWTGSFYSKSFLFSLIIILSQNILMATSSWLIFEIDKPFQGSIKATNQAFIDVKIELRELYPQE